jgi:hypothetical protein
MSITTAVATITTMADGDRLVIKVLFDDATGGSMADSKLATMCYNGQFPGAEGDSYLVCPDALAPTVAVPAAVLTKIRNLLRDTSTTAPLLTDAELKQAFEMALDLYSSDRPRREVEYYSGDNSTYKFRLPRFFVWGWSRIEEVEYPADPDDDQVRSLLANHNYEIRQTHLGTQPVRQLVLTNVIPELGTDNLLVTYTARHVHNDEASTVPASDIEALHWLAASLAAAAQAAKAAGATDPTIGADAVSHRDEAARWQSVSRNYRALYTDSLNLDRSSSSPAQTIGEWDPRNTRGRDWLQHGWRYR